MSCGARRPMEEEEEYTHLPVREAPPHDHGQALGLGRVLGLVDPVKVKVILWGEGGGGRCMVVPGHDCGEVGKRIHKRRNEMYSAARAM